MGHGSTLDYVAQAAGAVLAATGLLPHVNAGVMGEADLLRLRRVSASQARCRAASACGPSRLCGQHRRGWSAAPQSARARRNVTTACCGTIYVFFHTCIGAFSGSI